MLGVPGVYVLFHLFDAVDVCVGCFQINATTPWLSELGHGHGKHSFLVNKRRSSFTKATNGGEEGQETPTAPTAATCEFELESERTRTAASRTLSHGHIFDRPGIAGIDFGSKSSAFSIAANSRSSPNGCEAAQSGLGACLSAAAASQRESGSTATTTGTVTVPSPTGRVIESNPSGHNQESESFWDRPLGERSNIDIAGMYSGESGEVRSNLTQPVYSHGSGALSGSYSSMSGIGLSLSLQNTTPHSLAIPISGSVFDNSTIRQAHEKLAGSFVESRTSFLNSAELNRRVGHEGGIDDYEEVPRVLADVDSEVGSEEYVFCIVFENLSLNMYCFCVGFIIIIIVI